MKVIIVLVAIFAFSFSLHAQNSVGIGTQTPHASAMLEVNSTGKGMLIPRMNTAERGAIATPATGLMVYDTQTNSFWYHNGSAWVNLAAGGGGSGWGLTGNAGTNPATNFLGTTDAQPLNLRVTNRRFGLLDLNRNIFLGDSAGGKVLGGFRNIAIGSGALYADVNGRYLVAIGDSALSRNQTQTNSDFKDGRENTAIGNGALKDNTTGYSNTAIGHLAMYNNVNGSQNVAIGESALFSNIVGFNNLAMGQKSLGQNTTGDNNVALGFQSLASNQTGKFNTAIGTNALSFNLSGNNNVSFGYTALQFNQTGSDNIAIGTKALQNHRKSFVVAIGDSALYSNGLSSTLSIHATINTAVGSKAMRNNTTGYQNTATGYNALIANTTGNSNTAFGAYAMNGNTTATDNTAVGRSALYTNGIGISNVAIGSVALFGNSDGDYNTAVGVSALSANTLGNGNTTLGYNADVSVNNLSNAMALGYNSVVNASNKVVIGNSEVTSIGGYANWSNFSDGRFKRNVKEDVPGLSFISKLRPVTYSLDVEAINTFNAKGRESEHGKPLLNASRKQEIITGFMAQEVEQAARELNYQFSGIDKPEDDSKQTYALRYSDFIVPMVKAMQEQQQLIETLQKQVDNLTKKVELLLKK